MTPPRALSVLLFFGLTGCGGGTTTVHHAGDGQEAAGPTPPPYAQIAARHNQRIDALAELHSDGVVEITWTDDDGDHFEQGDIELWALQPSDLTVRISKLDEDIIWLGSDAERHWIIDARGDQAVYYLGDHDDADMNLAHQPIPLTPWALLDACGLSKLPVEGAAAAPGNVAHSAEHDAWVIKSAGRSGTLSLFFDRESLLPLRTEIHDAAGELILHSTLTRYKSVPLPNSPPGAWPQFPMRIEIIQPAQNGRVVLFGEDPEAGIEPGIRQRVFDFDRWRDIFSAVPADAESAAGGS